jgi:hypothetical protein
VRERRGDRWEGGREGGKYKKEEGKIMGGTERNKERGR